MKKLYTGLLISLMTCSLTAQTFTKITGTPFENIKNKIAIADIDNDSDQDLLLGAALFINNGQGLFEAGNSIPVNSVEVHAVAFADIDNNNDQDMVMSWMSPDVGKSEENNLHTKMFINDGNGNFLESPVFTTVGYKCGSVDFADIDNDYDKDILITGFTYGPTGSTLYPETILYINNGSGIYTESTDNNFADLGYGNSTFADVDNDDDLDVLLSGYNGTNAVSILYINDGSGVYTESTGNSFAGVGDCSNVFGDIDNDNDLDLLITGWSGIFGLSYTELYTNNGYGQFTQVTNTPFVVVGASAAAFSDVDNDNDLDVLITGLYLGKTYAELYTNDGNGGFGLVDDAPFVGAGKSSLAFADIDNDGDQDVIISGFADWINGEPLNPQTHVYRNNTVTSGVLETNPLFSDVSVYPNPNQGQVCIDFGELKNPSLKVHDMGGKLIYQKENISDPIYQFELNANPGLYIFELSSEQGRQQYKLIKE